MPCFPLSHQGCLHRIVLRVTDRLFQMLPIADECVEIFAFPESSAAVKGQIGRTCACSFPRMEEFRERSRPNVHHQMQMIRHDRPRLQLISLAIALAQLLLDESGNFRPTKPTRAVGAIQPGLDLAAALRSIPLVQNGLPFTAASDRKGVMQHEGYELSDVGAVKMRKVPRSCQPMNGLSLPPEAEGGVPPLSSASGGMGSVRSGRCHLRLPSISFRKPGL